MAVGSSEDHQSVLRVSSGLRNGEVVGLIFFFLGLLLGVLASRWIDLDLRLGSQLDEAEDMPAHHILEEFQGLRIFRAG